MLASDRERKHSGKHKELTELMAELCSCCSATSKERTQGCSPWTLTSLQGNPVELPLRESRDPGRATISPILRHPHHTHGELGITQDLKRCCLSWKPPQHKTILRAGDQEWNSTRIQEQRQPSIAGNTASKSDTSFPPFQLGGTKVCPGWTISRGDWEEKPEPFI